MGFASGIFHLRDEWCDQPSPLPQNSTDTCLPTQDPLRLAWSMQSWFIGPRRSLSYFSLPQPLTHTLVHTENPDPDRREKERNGSCHFSSFNWESAALSVTEPPRGRHQTEEQTFHILLSFTTESSYLFSHSVYLLFFIDFSHILAIYPPSVTTGCPSLCVL